MAPPRAKSTSLPLLSPKPPLLFSSMASQPFSPLILGISITLFISLFSPVHSVKCASQKLPENRTYANCTDLPSLDATLHHTYNATNRSLAVAFAASPPKPDGWVGWGINPSGGGMVGSQALIAFKLNGKVTVNTYNLTSYKSIDQAKLSFDVWDLTAVDADGVITIFAVLKLPEKSDNLSQVWQIGPSVTDGKPDKHEFGPANLKAKEALQVVGTTTAPGPGGSESGGGNSTANGNNSGGAMVMGERFGFGFYLGLVMVLVGFMSM